MKKALIVSILLICLFLVSLWLYLYFPQDKHTAIQEISVKQIKDKIENKENFTVFLYQKNCLSCNSLHDLVSEEASLNSNFYQLDINAEPNKRYLLSELRINKTPVLLGYRNGELIYRNDGLFQDHDLELLRDIQSHQASNNLLKVSWDTWTDSLQDHLNNYSLVLERDSCQDCSVFNQYLSTLHNLHNKLILVVLLDDIHAHGKQEWQEFKRQQGFVETPCLQIFENGKKRFSVDWSEKDKVMDTLEKWLAEEKITN